MVNHHKVALPTRDYGVPAVEVLDEEATDRAVPIVETRSWSACGSSPARPGSAASSTTA